MRSNGRPDLDGVLKEFEAWRRRSPQPPFPVELWRAACALLDRYSAHTICQTLRLNESRFKQMRGAVGSKANETRRGEDAKKRETPVFVDLGVVGAPPDLHTRNERISPSCSLVIERPDGARLTLEWPAPDSSSIAMVCTSFLESGDPSPRRRR
jgi:hypothetical protein